MKTSLHLFLIFTLVALPILNLYAQKEKFLSNEMAGNGTVKFRRYDISISPHSAANEKELLKAALSTSSGDSLAIVSIFNDSLGFTHKFYQQYYNGIKIENATYSTHLQKGLIVTINGEFARVGKPVLVPKINEAEALQSALKYINAATYRWQVPEEETLVKEIRKDRNASYYPKSEIVICYDYLQTKTYRLAYKFLIAGYLPLSSDYVFVDAINGNIIAKQNLLFDGNVSTTGKTRYSGTQAMVTDQFVTGGVTSYRLQEVRGATNTSIQSFNSQRLQNTAHVDFTDATNAWTTLNNVNQDDAAIDAHWATEKIYDYWNTIRSRNSYDNTGAALISFIHYNQPYLILNGVPQYHSGVDNAGWDGGAHQVYLGDGYVQCNPLVSFDACSHEFAHGFTEGAQAALFAAGGILRNADGAHPEALALNEGISDIWAAVVENWGTSGKQNWLIGEEIMKNGKPCLRSLINPKTGGDPTGTAHNGYPDTYHDSYWDYNNEPHTNSTVLSHWFYLLCQGGSGTNSLGTAYNVTGIGITSAASIVWRAEQNYFGANTDYAAARTALINAAIDIFGACSPEVTQVTNAWFAVGVGTAIPTNNTYTITGINPICTSAQYSINNLPGGTTVKWFGQQPYSTPTLGFNTTTSNPTTVSYLTGPSFNTLIYAALNVPGTGCVLTPVKSVHVGGPSSVSLTGIQLVPYPYYGITANVVTDAPAPYYWYIDGVLKKTTTSTSSDVVTAGQCGVQHYFQVGVTNGCGSQLKTLPYYFTNTCGMGAFVMAPNPAVNQVAVSALSPASAKGQQSIEEEEISVTKNNTRSIDFNSIQSKEDLINNKTIFRQKDIVQIKIYDVAGLLRKSIRYGSNTHQVNINIADLNAGIYFVEVFDGVRSERKKLIVQK